MTSTSKLSPREALYERVRLLQADRTLAHFLALVGAAVILERFFLRAAAWHLWFVASGISGTLLIYWLWWRAIDRVDPIPPGSMGPDGTPSRRAWWLALFASTVTSWATLAAATALAVAVQFLPALWVDARWEPEPMAFARATGFQLSTLGALIADSAKDQLWVAWFTGIAAYLPARLSAAQQSAFLGAAGLTRREIAWVAGVLIAHGLPLLIWQIAIAATIPPEPDRAKYLAHILGQALFLIACLPGYLLLYLRRWRRVMAE